MRSISKQGKCLLLLVAIIILPSITYAGSRENLENLEQGQKYFNAGDYNNAFKLWQELAKNGQPEAQVFIGLAYANGWGVKKNLDEASNWYMKAAENNNPSGQFLLGLHYVTTGGNQYDVKVGIKWLKRAAENGDQSAIRFLKKAKKRNWFTELRKDGTIDKYEIEKEGRSILDSYSLTANVLPKLPAPSL